MSNRSKIYRLKSEASSQMEALKVKFLEDIDHMLTSVAMEIIATLDIDTEEGRKAFEARFAEEVIDMAREESGTTFMTDNSHGFLQPLVMKKLLSAAQDCGFYAVRAKYGSFS